MDKATSPISMLERMYQHNRWPTVIVLAGDKALRADILSSFVQLAFCQHQQRCGVCPSCLLVQANTHPDIHYIQPEQLGHAIKIDQIRDLLEVCLHTPLLAAQQLIIIEQADALNVSAANALLKVLEEPSLKTHFMLLLDHEHMLLPTIRSRAWLINGLGRAAVPDVQPGLQALKPILMSFLQDELSMSQLLDFFAGQSLEQSLCLLQYLSHHVFMEKSSVSTKRTVEELAFLAVAPSEAWWRFYDFTLECRRCHPNLQANLVLSRLFFMLKGFY